MTGASLPSRKWWVIWCALFFFSIGPMVRTANVPDVRNKLPRISSRELVEMVDKAVAAVDKRLDTDELNIYRKGVVLDPGSPAWFAAASSKTKVVAKNLSRMALVAEEATRSIAQQYKLNRDQIVRLLPTLDVRGTALERSGKCPLAMDFPCQPRKYRAYSGYCNNVQNPRWGNANTAYLRYLGPQYDDSVSSPRQLTASGDGPLPSARRVSLSVHLGADSNNRPHPHLTVLLAVFAQFVFHDIFHTSQHAGHRGHRIKCCGASLVHPECFPIVGEKDFCADYVRSSNVPRAGCTLGPREQINQVTSFLDGSVIYGSSEEEVKRLRTLSGGLLRLREDMGLLPPDTSNPHDCRGAAHKCFLAGDVRVNENAGLAALHTAWAREHNRVAVGLSETNPEWNDEQLFEETRRIVGAELQHITYSELLPALLGTQVLRQFDLEPSQGDSFYKGYGIDMNAGASNAFSSAVAAALYSMMPSHLFLYAQSASFVSYASSVQAPRQEAVFSVPIGESHFFPDPLYREGSVDQLLLGMMNQRAQFMDGFISPEMNNNLQDDKDKQGMDLAAWVIQRGRDHGLPGYVEWRRVCRLQPTLRNLTDLRLVMTDEAAKRIAGVYKDIRDIDLFTGGLSEKPLVGAAVGPTFACLLSRQFQHLKRGDRFWYENDMPPNAFTKDQLREIRKASLSRIICRNTGQNISMLQPQPLLMPDAFLNAFQMCNDSSPDIDFSKWKMTLPSQPVPKETLLTSLKEAMRQARKRIEAEREIFSNEVGVADPRSAQAVHHVLLRPKRQAARIANRSLLLELASKQFLLHESQQQQLRDPERRPSDNEISATMLALSAQDVEDLMVQQQRAGEELDGRCRLEEEQVTLPCDHTSPYRTASGWCNNLQNPHWGKALVTLQRLLPPQYQDGVSAPRSQGVHGRPLPSPRLVSTVVHYETESPHPRYSLALMQWGQFLDHDLTLTPMHEALDRRPLDCKACDSATTVHPECFPIPVPPDDPFFPAVYRNASKNCISFARSLAGQRTLGHREQMDQVTSYIDASSLYGSDACEARMLRDPNGAGRLNSTRHPLGGKELLPQDLTNVECRAPSGICFESGDIRASEQPGLTCMHTVWMREHNRLAELMADINPHWDDERLYQEVRRIVSAMVQHITYTDFLPRVLGENTMVKKVLSSPPSHRYDSTCDATVLNEFAAAAYRFGHTLLKPAFPRLSPGHRPSGYIRLRTAFFNPDVLYEKGAIDEVLRGLLSGSVEVFDHSITSEVTNHLFEDRNQPRSGMDLVALNLQRGRDHGLRPYNEYRVLCNLSRAEKFDDLERDIPGHIVERLKKVYEHVDDIDLFTGGVAERPMYGALVGSTFGCILSHQFSRLRNCDRFFYETQDPFLRFTSDQLQEIRKTSLSKVICDNSDAISTVQAKAFDLPDDFLNPRMACKNLPALDLSPWRDGGVCNMGSVSVAVGHSRRTSPCVSCSCTKEGMVCQSLKIRNCFQLASSYTREFILQDDVCKVQCAFAFRTYPQFEANLDNVLGFTIQK